MVCVETNSNQVADKCSASESNWNWGKLCPEFQNGIVWVCLWGGSRGNSSQKPRSRLPATFSTHKCIYIRRIKNFLRLPWVSKNNNNNNERTEGTNGTRQGRDSWVGHVKCPEKWMWNGRRDGKFLLTQEQDESFTLGWFRLRWRQ